MYNSRISKQCKKNKLTVGIEMNTEIHLCINTWMNKPPPQKTHCPFKQCQTESSQSDLHINVINQRAHSKLIDVCSVHNEEQQHCTAASASPECLLTAAALSGFPFLFHCGNWNCRCEAPCTGTSLVKREVLHDLFSEYLEYRLLFLTSRLLFWLKKKKDYWIYCSSTHTFLLVITQPSVPDVSKAKVS